MKRSIIPWAAFVLLLSPAAIAARSNLHYTDFLVFLGLVTLSAIFIPAALLILPFRHHGNRSPQENQVADE